MRRTTRATCAALESSATSQPCLSGGAPDRPAQHQQPDRGEPAAGDAYGHTRPCGVERDHQRGRERREDEDGAHDAGNSRLRIVLRS